MQRHADEPTIRRALREPTSESIAAARSRLIAIATPGPRRIEIWNDAGSRVIEVSVPGPSAAGGPNTMLPPLARAPETPGIQPLQADGPLVFSDLVAAIRDDVSTGSSRLGSLVVRTTFTLNPPGAIRDVVGRNTIVAVGNKAGSVWTDLSHSIPGPRRDRPPDTTSTYKNANGDDRVDAVVDISGTPWAVWVDVPALKARSPLVLNQMIVVTLVCVVGGALLTRMVVARVVRPLAELRTATAAIATGDYSRRVATNRRDEIGALADAFNTMSGRVQETQQQLEERVQERTRALNEALATLQRRSATQDAYVAAIVDSSDDAIIGRDMSGTITSWNTGAEAIFGYAASEIVGASIMRLIPAGRQDEERQILEQITRGAHVKHFETLRQAKDGRLIDVSIAVSAIKDATGTVIGISKVIRDITERKRVEEAQRVSEARYRALFDYAPDGIVIADREGRYLDANASMCRMLGYARDELIGMPSKNVVAPSEVQHIDPALEAITTTTDYRREWQFRRKDRSVFSADVMATVMPDGNLMAMIRDVSERNQAIEAVRTAEERMRFALQAANVGIWDMDYTTGKLQWSETLEAHYGVRAGAFEGTFEAFIERVQPDDRASLMETIGTAMKSGSDFSTAHRSIWPDGQVRWLSGAGRILVDARGHPVRGVGISMDITERRTLEQQYQQAQKMEAIGQLAGGVAHDFNNLLTAILGFGQLVLDSFDANDPRRGDVEQVLHAGNRAAALTKQLLAFSRKEVVQRVAVNMNDVIVATHKMLARLIGEHIEVQLALADDLGSVHADPGQLDQVLVNLAVNARDAMPDGGRLTIETANVDLDASFSSQHGPVEPGPYVMLAVSDTGTGMTEDTRTRLFEPFFTTKERGKGTGLGLSTVFGIVKQNGGHLYVYSEPGHGATFKIYLPRLAADVRIAGATTDLAVRSGSETVLLVEDEQAVRLLVKIILENAGYRVLEAGSPRDAEIVLGDRATDIDVLVTDMIMPGGTGPALFAQLRTTHPRLGVLYISGYTDDAMFRTGRLDAGMAFLQKPFAADGLLRKLREILDARLAGRA